MSPSKIASCEESDRSWNSTKRFVHLIRIFYFLSISFSFDLYSAGDILMPNFRESTVIIKSKYWLSPRGSNPSPSAYEWWATRAIFSVILCSMAVCLLLHRPPLDETMSPRRKQGGRRKWIFRSHSITIEPRTAREAAWMLQTNIKIRNLTMESIAEDPYLKFESSQMLCQLSR